MLPVSPDLYFPIEIVTREYAGHLLLGTEMAARGRTVVIGHKGSVARTAGAARRRGVVFYKNARFPDWMTSLHELVGMDPEAGIVERDFTVFHRVRQVVARDSVNRAQFCFGPDDHDLLVEEFPDLRHRIHLTGSPRVELWGVAGEDFYSAASARIRAHYGDLVLFTSSGGFAHETVLSWEGADPDTTWDAADHAHHFFRMGLTASQNGLTVVVRPHPADSWTAWQRAVADVPGMHIDTTYDLAAWTRVALAIVHPGTSTAAFEAVCAGTPAISTQSNVETNAATDLSHLARDAEHLMQLLTQARNGDLATFPTAEAQRRLERKLLHPRDGATFRVADILDEVVPPQGPSGVDARKSRARGAVSRRFGKRGPQRTLGDQRPRPFKRDPLFLETVERDVASCLRILGRTDDVKVRELDENCFALSL